MGDDRGRWDNEDRRRWLRVCQRAVRDETATPEEREKARADAEFWKQKIREHADEY